MDKQDELYEKLADLYIGTDNLCEYWVKSIGLLIQEGVLKSQQQEKSHYKQINKMEELKNTKLFVANEKQSRKAQEKLFALGFRWWAGLTKDVCHLSSRFLVIDDDLTITHTPEDKKYFDSLNHKEIYFDDLMQMRVKEEFIPCPMEFELVSGNRLGLKFDVDRSIYLQPNNKLVVNGFLKTFKTKVRVEPTPNDKLEVGKWYVVRQSSDLNKNILEKPYYRLYTGDGEYYLIANEFDIIKNGATWDNWHEVVLDE